MVNFDTISLQIKSNMKGFWGTRYKLHLHLPIPIVSALSHFLRQCFFLSSIFTSISVFAWRICQRTCLTLARPGFYVLFLFHLLLVSEPTPKGDVSNLSMQNIAMSIFWWLASHLKLAYPSEVYCNLSLMIGPPVIDGGIARAPRRPPAVRSLASSLWWRGSQNLWNVLWPSKQSESTNIILT